MITLLYDSIPDFLPEINQWQIRNNAFHHCYVFSILLEVRMVFLLKSEIEFLLGKMLTSSAVHLIDFIFVSDSYCYLIFA